MTLSQRQTYRQNNLGLYFKEVNNNGIIEIKVSSREYKKLSLNECRKG